MIQSTQLLSCLSVSQLIQHSLVQPLPCLFQPPVQFSLLWTYFFDDQQLPLPDGARHPESSSRRRQRLSKEQSTATGSEIFHDPEQHIRIAVSISVTGGLGDDRGLNLCFFPRKMQVTGIIVCHYFLYEIDRNWSRINATWLQRLPALHLPALFDKSISDNNGNTNTAAAMHVY